MVPRDRTTRPHPRTRGVRRWVIGAVACAVLVTAGCKSKGGSGGGGSRGGDPLLGQARIPPQDLPVPGRGDAYGASNRRDPLLDPGSPALPTSAPTDRTEGPPPKPKATGDTASLPPPPLPKGPPASVPNPGDTYRPDRTSSPAALAPLPTDDADLSVGRRPPPDRGIPASIPAGPTFAQVSAVLKQYGATWDPPVNQGGQWVFRCDLPVRNGQPGQMRRYEGTGPSQAAAAKQVLDQVKADYGRR